MLTITVPRLPMSPNGPRGMLRSHWATRRMDREVWRVEVLAALRSAGIPAYEGQYIAGEDVRRRKVHIHQVRKRLLDADNLTASCKHVLDALVSCGVIVDDSPGWIELTVTQETAKKDHRTEIRVE